MADRYLQLYERLIGAARLPRVLDTFSRPGGPDRQSRPVTVSSYRSSEAEDAPLFGPMIEMSLTGIQARGQLLGVAVSVESSSGTTTALVLDVPLLGSSDLL
jgi:hypothetical protein